jgi:hypothetical protein
LLNEGWIVLLQTRCVCETQMPPRDTNSIDSHAHVKAFEKVGQISLT